MLSEIYQKINCYLIAVSKWGAAICLVSLLLLIVSQIILRFFGTFIPSSEDIAGWLLSAAIFLSLAYSFKEGVHIQMQLVLQSVQPHYRYYLIRIILILALVISAYWTWTTAQQIYESWQYQDLTQSYVAMPLWLVQLPMFIGLAILTNTLIDATIALKP